MLDVSRAPVELRALAAALRGMDAPLRREIDRQTRAELAPMWKEAVSSRARSRLDRAVLVKGTRIRTGNPPALIAAASKRKMRGGMIPAADWLPVEFGTKKHGTKTTYRRTSPNGRTHTVRRRTAQQLPTRNPGGRVVFAATKEVAPRLVSLWVATAVRTIHEELDKTTKG